MATIEEQANAKVALLNSNIWQLGLIVRDRVQWLSDYRRNPIDFYNAAFSKLSAVEAQLSGFRSYLDENDAELDMRYYDNEYEAFRQQLEGFRFILPRPQVTKEVAESERLSGTITKIDDGDTVFIKDARLTDPVECRLAGIDAEEAGSDVLGPQATAVISEMLPIGTKVTLKIDKHSPIDVYGRALGVLFRDSDNLNVNIEMLKRCAAKVTTKYPRHRYISQIEYEQAAEKCSLAFPHFGVLKLYSDPTHAAVRVDGEDIKQITPAEIPLRVGKHHIELVKYDYAAHHEDMDIQVGATVINRKLVKLPTSEGLLVVETEPDGLEILVDGLPAGMSPVYMTVVAKDTHTIEASTSDGKKDSGMVSVVPGKTTTVVLTPK